jgi:hypothetical protein
MTHIIETFINSPKPKRFVLSQSKVLTVELILGNPLIECRRFGICKIDIWDKKKQFISKSYNHTLAKMYLQPKSACILLKFKPVLMNKVTLQQFFGERGFLLESDFHFSSAYGLPNVYFPLVIAQGCYSVEQMGQYLVVRLPYITKSDILK